MPSPTRTQMLVAIVVALVAFAAVACAGIALAASPGWTAIDLGAVVAVNRVDVPVLTATATVIAVIFGPVAAAVITLVLVVGAGFVTRSFPTAVRLGLLIAFPWASADLVKAVVRRDRPDPALLPHPLAIEPSTFSYPSGHTAFAVALCAAFVVVLTGSRRRIALVVGILVVALTAWSRVQLGAHYPTDVLASIALVPTATWAMAAITARIRWFEASVHLPTPTRVPHSGGVDRRG